MKSKKKHIRVCYVLSYSSPQYVRTEFLLSSLRQIDGVEVFTAINSSKGITRYLQTLWRLLLVRIRYRPDVYILGFRGYEIFFPVRLMTIGKPLIFDEFINPYLWFVEEHRKFKPGSIVARMAWLYARLMLISSRRILSDTLLHAKYSSEKLKVSPDKFTAIYVGTNEEVFQDKTKQSTLANKSLEVFFYGNFLPLHGIGALLEAADILRDEAVTFTIIGGAKRQQDMQSFLREIKSRKLKNVFHKPWVPYEELPDYIARADLCLGGPFGNTPQSNLVITGKTYQFLSMGKCTVVGKIDEDAGFKDKRNCLLVDQGDINSLVTSIRWAKDHQDLLDDIGQEGKQLYGMKFSQAAQLDKVRQVLVEALK